METFFIPVAVTLLGLAIPVIVLAYAAIDTARWEREGVDLENRSGSGARGDQALGSEPSA